MRRFYRNIFIAGLLLFALLLTGCGKDSKTMNEVRYFSEWTSCEAFKDIPAIYGKGLQIGEGVKTYGTYYQLEVDGGTTDTYWNYLDLLEKQGFNKYVDNGEKGLNDNVYSATFTKDELVLTVIHMAKSYKTYLIAEEEAHLSDRLIYDEKYVEDNKTGAKTTLTLVELWKQGNSFVIQLKNGHFLVNDGGHEEDLPNLLNYLESLTPDGEKPVVEGWFLSHPHADHIDFLNGFINNPTNAQRLLVDGFYVNQYNMQFADEVGASGGVLWPVKASTLLKTQDGGHPKIYRPHAGQRYYFSDITIDVMLTMVQVRRENYYKYEILPNNLNELSDWLMFNIDGQKFLVAGDADFGAMKSVMRTYDQEYLNMDVMAVQHHGINVHKDFTDFIKVKTLIYPHYGSDGMFLKGTTWQASEDRNAYLKTRAQEYVSYGDGGKVLTFPYVVKSVKSLPYVPERSSITNAPTGKQYIIYPERK